ncbi:MAG TPA: ferredoxin [Saprospirales bacterium]|nr:ferredoxin [Saprospirales bacterium]HAY70578.1 ferredoxin [Saprospirales bacterium]HRQ29517.1 RnfABCDGE type electron transport complex subunit B [Saprospiraceae bacterium]
MTDAILYTVGSLSGLGLVSAFVLFVVASKFKVYENPKIGQVEEMLPNSNCGGCGLPGCRPFAEALVEREDISDLFCPVGGNDVMKSISTFLGKDVAEKDPMVAVLRCNGTCEARPKVNTYDGAKSCKISAMTFAGDTGCDFGCDGHGDCVAVCDFDALYMDPVTHLPVVITDNCTACNACVLECPKNLFELRPKKKKDLKIYVACMNEDKAGIARKACSHACIACNKCVDVCPKDAITIENNVAYIHADLCTLCRKCAPVCPTNAIIETGFPPKKEKTEVAPAKVSTIEELKLN